MACVPTIGVPSDVAWLSRKDFEYLLAGLPGWMKVGVSGRIGEQDRIREAGELFVRRAAVDEAIEHEKACRVAEGLEASAGGMSSVVEVGGKALDIIGEILDVPRKRGENDQNLRQRIGQVYGGGL